MLIAPQWDKFKSKFADNPQKAFEWFCYLLFCREFGLDKGWISFHNQSAIETEPVEYNGDIIGFQSKFYEVSLTNKKAEIIKMLKTAKRDYPLLTKLYFYTNQQWAKAKGTESMVFPKSFNAIEIEAQKLGITIDWRTHSFFESEFVALTHHDLARYFFNENDFLGWRRFTDWSSKKADIDEEYLIDDNVKIITPNHRTEEALDIVTGINHLRHALSQPKACVRLVGLSGVGKTRLAQALFDKRVGDMALDIKQVWYCDTGDSPNPIPQHFIEIMSQTNQQYILIVDNCGHEQHKTLTKLVKEQTNFSLLTIEYDITDDQPAETSIYKMQPTTTELLEKVLARHYPDIPHVSLGKIAENSGGNYRLALAIASNIDATENLSILTDEDLFKRLFFQKGNLDEQQLKVAQIFSLVFSFNIEDEGEKDSEFELLSALAEVSCREAYRIIESFNSRDIVQQRGEYRAVLPHALANNLARQAIQNLSKRDINHLFNTMTDRLKSSFIKRISYLHDDKKTIEIVKEWFKSENYLGQLILTADFEYSVVRNIDLLIFIYPDEILNLIQQRSQLENDFLSTANTECYSLAKILGGLAYYERNFEQAFWLLYKIVKTEEYGTRNHSTKDLLTGLFNYHLSQTEASFAIKKQVIEKLFATKENHRYLIDILESALNLHVGGILYNNDANGIKTVYSYTPDTYDEMWDWFDFLLDKLFQLDLNSEYSEKCRKIVSANLKDIIYQCRNTTPVFKHIKNFHDRYPFHSVLLAIKRILKYESKQLEENAPTILQEIKALQTYLMPKNTDISILLQTYVLTGEHYEYRSKLYGNDDFAFTIDGFDDYEDLIAYISQNITKEIVTDNLLGLMQSHNSFVKDIGAKAILLYETIDGFISELDSLSQKATISNSRFFIVGIMETLLNENIDSYHQLTNFLFNHPNFSADSSYFMALASTKQEHFDSIIEKIIQYPELNFAYLGDELSSKKYFNRISNDVFETTLDKLIELEQWDIVETALVSECLRNSTLAERYVKILLNLLPNILKTHKDFYRYQAALTFLLKQSEKAENEIFRIIDEILAENRFLFSISNTPLSHVLDTILKVSPLKTLDFIYQNNNDRFEYLLLNKKFQHSFGALDKNTVLTWINSDQDKIDYWLSNAKLYSTENETWTWFELLFELLKLSNNSTESLKIFIESQVLRINCWSGERSNAMTIRLNSLVSLKDALVKQNLLYLLPIINNIIIAYKKQIDEEIENEFKEAEKNNRFDW